MNIQLKRTKKEDFEIFKKDVKDIFSLAVIEEFGSCENGGPISEEDLEESLYAPQSVVYDILWDEKKAGGIVLNIDEKSGRNEVALFFIYPNFHSKGIGSSVWKLVEKTYPETKVWELVTPYFEKRNIHFYVNKCGFHIVEFFCKCHRDSDGMEQGEEFKEEYFRFEKRMNRGGQKSGFV